MQLDGEYRHAVLQKRELIPGFVTWLLTIPVKLAVLHVDMAFPGGYSVTFVASDDAMKAIWLYLENSYEFHGEVEL